MIDPTTEAIWALLASFFVLASGPLLVRVASRSPVASATLDGFSMGAVVLLVMVHLLPPVLERLGPWALLALLIGLLLPRLFHRFEPGALTRSAQGVTVALVILGLAIHAAFDGAALPMPGPEGRALRIAVVIHRLPLAMLIWSLMRGRFGIRIGFLSLTALGVFSALGLYAGNTLLGVLDADGVAAFQAVMVGSLLHLLFDNGPQPHQPRAEGAGALVGFFFVALLPHDDHGAHAGVSFLHLALEVAPALLLGYTLAGASVLLPQIGLDGLRSGTWSQAARGLAYGIPAPVSSGGALPRYRTLHQRGVPGVAAITFLVATPALSLESVLLSFPLLGHNFAGARLVAAGALAVVVGVVVGRQVLALPASNFEPEPRSTLRTALAFGFKNVVDHTAAWVLFGLAAAAALSSNDLVGGLSRLPEGWDVPLLALVGLPLYVCASGATPLAAALIAAGASPGAALAFLLTGPATNLTTLGSLAQLHGKKIAAMLAVGVAALAILAGWSVNNFAPRPVVGHGHGDLFAPLHWIALGLLALLLTASLMRQGLRGLLGGLLGELR